jgi:Carboxypeptidase regulatory-like domain
MGIALSAQDSDRKGRITGTVLDLDGKPLAAAIVKANYTGSLDGIVPRAKTNKAGRFLIEHLAFGRYQVTAAKEQDGYPDVSNAFYAGLQPNAAIIQLDSNHPQHTVTVLVGRKAGVLSGKVIDADTGKAVDPCAEFRRSDDPSITWSGSGLLKPTFHLLVPADTDFTLMVWQRGYEPWFYQDESGGASLRIHSEKQLKLEIKMKPTADKNRPPTDEELKAMVESAGRFGCPTPPPIKE